MIPTTDLLRLLDRLISADSLRERPAQIRQDGFGSFLLDWDDVQSFATLSRIAAGEVWEGFPSGGTVEIPRSLLSARSLEAGAGLLYGQDRSMEAGHLRRLAQISKQLEQERES